VIFSSVYRQHDSQSPPSVLFVPVSRSSKYLAWSFFSKFHIHCFIKLSVKKCPSGPFTSCSFCLKADSRKRRNGGRECVVFSVNLSDLPYQPRPNPVVNEGVGCQKMSVQHRCAFGSPVSQHKACKLTRHCCLAHSSLLALQQRWIPDHYYNFKTLWV